MSETLWHSAADPGSPSESTPSPDTENADVVGIYGADENSGESGGVVGEVSGPIGKMPDEGSTRANAAGLGGSRRPCPRQGACDSREWRCRIDNWYVDETLNLVGVWRTGLTLDLNPA